MNTLIVILNYRTAALTIDCLHSLAGEVAESGDRVVVVDGASGDGSADLISRAIDDNHWQCWASLLPLSENRGYAASNNAAIKPAMELGDPPRYVVILNPDTIVRPHAMTSLVEFMETHPE